MTETTFIDFLLDETGSMGSCQRETVAGYSNYIESLKGDGACYLTLCKFDSAGLRIPYVNLAVEMVPPLTFYPNASTNLYDCIGERLTEVLNQDRSGKSLFVIMTDGGDNASRNYTIETARDLILHAQERGVVVVYLGPNNSALDVGARLGIPTGNIKSFDTANMRETMDDLSSATSAFRSGTTSAAKFFEGDTQNVA